MLWYQLASAVKKKKGKKKRKKERKKSRRGAQGETHEAHRSFLCSSDLFHQLACPEPIGPFARAAVPFVATRWL